MHSTSNQAPESGGVAKTGLANRYYWVTLLFLFVFAVVWTQQHNPSRNTDTPLRIQNIAYLEDVNKTKTVVEVLQLRAEFTDSAEESLNFGLSDSAYWIWVSLDRPHESTRSLFVEIGYPHLDFLDVYRVEDNDAHPKYELGDSVPFNKRPVDDRMFLLPIPFNDSSQSADILLRVESQGTVQIPLSVKTPDQYHSHVRTEQLVLGLYYGILLGVFAYNFLLAVGLKDPVYVYYCSYAVCQALFQFTQNGLAFAYVWPGWTSINQVAIPLLACLSLLFSTRFTHLFLNITKENSPRLFSAFCVAEYIFAALALSTLFLDLKTVIILVAIACSASCVFTFVTASIIYIRGDQNAKFYLIAWSLLIFGVIIYAAKAIGFLPETFFTVHAVQIGSVIEMILLSYALADRFNRLRDENIKVQYEAKAMLEKNVEHRTKELNDALQKLQLANNQLESINQRDPLTNIYNRSYFNTRLKNVWEDNTLKSLPLSLMMIDIDHFKSINDTRGHLIGDEVIIKVAETLDTLCRNTDCIPARFGGEEFIVLLPEHDRYSTLSIAEQLRKDIEALEFCISLPSPPAHHKDKESEASNNETFSITVSVGVSGETPFPTSLLSGGLHLIDQADKALYNAKQTGRNRCCLYQPDDTDIERAA